MALALGIILYLIYMAVYIAAATMSLTLLYMPYVLGGIASLIIYSQNPGIQTWIPGRLTPDSVGYCLFVSVVYLFLSAFAVQLNLRNLPE